MIWLPACRPKEVSGQRKYYITLLCTDYFLKWEHRKCNVKNGSILCGRIKHSIQFHLGWIVSLYSGNDMLYDRTCIKLNNCISPFCFMLTYLLKNNFVRISVCKYIRISLSHSWSRLETLWKIMKEAHFHNLSMDNWHVHKTCIWIINKFLFLNYLCAAVNKKNDMCCCLLSPMKHLMKHMFN